MKKLTRLQLDFEYNNIGDKGCEYLSNGLKDLKELTILFLYLPDNIIGAQGSECLSNSRK